MDFLLPADEVNEKTIGQRYELVEKGKYYQDFDHFQERALEAYLSERQLEAHHGPTFPAEASRESGPGERVYGPLDGKHEMRILELHQGEFDDILRCELHICSVEFEYSAETLARGKKTSPFCTYYVISRDTGEPIWYTAISYVWGDSAFVKPIICEGISFHTTHNLDLALRYLRRTDVSVMLWADQICINQKDPEEKTQQVLLMGKIYRRAWSTLVWLGEEADNSDDAIDVIITVGDHFQGVFDEMDPNLAADLPARGSQRWLDLSKFLGRPWFRRIWVIQEVVLSHRVQLQCGRRSISWTDFGMFAMGMNKNDFTQYIAPRDNAGSDVDRLSESAAACTQIHAIERMKSIYDYPGDQLILLTSLVDGRGALATDPKDKVFGVMGMSDMRIHPDYSKNVSDIYIEAARKIIVTADYPFDLLSCVDHDQPSTQRPSWVPDWSNPRQTTSLGFYGERQGVYEAAKGTTRRDSKMKLVSDRLFINGIIFDTISHLKPLAAASLHLEDLPDSTSPTASFVLHSMQMAIQNCHHRDSGLFSAFLHTLVAGKNHSGFLKIPPEFSEIFALLLDSVTGTSPSMPDQPLPDSRRRLTLDNLRFRRPARTFRDMQIAFEAAVKGRRFGTTEGGFMGIFPRGARPGDRICVFLGGHVPFVLRPVQEGNEFSYQLMGECYVHGIMDGEVVQMTNLKEEEVQII